MSERKGTRALEIWCKRLVNDCPNVQIENMTTSWRSGLAFCALVQHFRPDLIDVGKLKPENIYENNQLAFSVAEKHLGIPALLDPEDMVSSEVPDRLSILTYLSQFYQRLGHTVNTKADSVSETDSAPAAAGVAGLEFGKCRAEACAACAEPVYLAQRLMVGRRLFHRRCFRCSLCAGHLNPNHFKTFVGTEFVCDSCKTDKATSKYLNNNDLQMGMLAFTDDSPAPAQAPRSPEPQPRPTRSSSILDKINMFEKKTEESRLDESFEKLSINSTKDNSFRNSYELSSQKASTSHNNMMSGEGAAADTAGAAGPAADPAAAAAAPPHSTYKSDANKYTFLKTQLDTETDTGNGIDIKNTHNFDKELRTLEDGEDVNKNDDSQLSNCSNFTQEMCEEESETLPVVVIPPRRKKILVPPVEKPVKGDAKSDVTPQKQYPDHLNPFSDDESEDDDDGGGGGRRASTNPFGSSDDDADTVPRISVTAPAGARKQLISANPFWSDGEEPSDEDDFDRSGHSSLCDTSLATSTASGRTPRRKPRAPPPPAPPPAHPPHPPLPADDAVSLSSVSSYNSTAHSDQRSIGRLTPQSRKKRPAPTPPPADRAATPAPGDPAPPAPPAPACGPPSLDSCTSKEGRKPKGPAPGLPLPRRREVRAALPAAELAARLQLLETQQLGLERQGVLVERMIRDKCEGANAGAVPQEEVEDLVIQLCELVNEKNDLFRKQTELMYLRRQQRLEQEQADIEHEVRVLQSRPAAGRRDADREREEQLVSRLVEVVAARDRLVQQLDAERRREHREDRAIAACIASKRAQRASDSNSSSLAAEAAPRRSRVKDKVKKQLRKAKHSLHIRKKDKDDKDDSKLIEKDKKEKKKGNKSFP